MKYIQDNTSATLMSSTGIVTLFSHTKTTHTISLDGQNNSVRLGFKTRSIRISAKPWSSFRYTNGLKSTLLVLLKRTLRNNEYGIARSNCSTSFTLHHLRTDFGGKPSFSLVSPDLIPRSITLSPSNLILDKSFSLKLVLKTRYWSKLVLYWVALGCIRLQWVSPFKSYQKKIREDYATFD